MFKEPDQAIFDIGSTLELLNTASNIHNQIKTTEKARSIHKHYKNISPSIRSMLRVVYPKLKIKREYFTTKYLDGTVTKTFIWNQVWKPYANSTKLEGIA